MRSGWFACKQTLTRGKGTPNNLSADSSGGWFDHQGLVDPVTKESLFEDGRDLIGCRVWVQGKGPGLVKDFKKVKIGTSKHVIEFELGTDGTPIDSLHMKEEAMVLDRKGNSGHRWLVEYDQEVKLMLSVLDPYTSLYHKIEANDNDTVTHLMDLVAQKSGKGSLPLTYKEERLDPTLTLKQARIIKGGILKMIPP